MEKLLSHLGQPLVYEMWGNGEPCLVLLHGFAETPAVFAPLLPLLEPHCRLIIPWMPGTGPSASLPKGAGLEEMGDAVAAMLDQENVPQVVMAGHSMGGYATVAFAEKYPDRLRGFGLLNSSAYADDEDKKNVRRKGIQFMQEKGSRTFLEETAGNLFSKTYRQMHTGEVANYISAGSNQSTNSLIAYYEMMMQRPDRRQVLNLNMPILFVMGTEDNAVPLKIALEQSVIPQNAYIHILENTGHVSMMEAPDRTAQALLAFMHHT